MIGIDTDTLTLVLDGIALEMIGKVWICLVMMSTDNNVCIIRLQLFEV
jgi:hypothetical protein